MKKFIVGLVLSVPLIVTGIPSLSMASTTISQPVEKAENQLNLQKIGEKALDKMLKQQKKDFEGSNPLLNSDISKLTETDEAVLIYYGTTEVDKRKLQEFTYDIQNFEVYTDEQGKSYVEAYVIRSFKFEGQDVLTQLGDDIKLEIKVPSSQLNKTSKMSETSIQNIAESPDNIQLSSNTAEAKNKDNTLTLDKFLERYQEEVDKEPISIVQDKEDLKMELQNSPSLAAASYSYYGTNAAAYARKYALSPNTASYKYYSGEDCTNFVSQSIKAGGMPNFTDWKAYTDAWVNAGAFRDYIRQSGGILMSTVTDDYAHAFLGDVYHYDYRNKYFLNSPDGWMDHTAIVTAFANPKILVSYHSTNRLNVTREFFTSVEGGVRYLSDIK
ncbi:amidase domain-containing protein [Rossellomorea vietnamensis]|uniref:amidase domain-containing protein n=1 Tax=Rossellomorea vietnamensis TaxID=218284 RepID=UPI00077CC3CE|nr:amidase domain-containing protein [Rossellomorea vietnamensis]